MKRLLPLLLLLAFFWPHSSAQAQNQIACTAGCINQDYNNSFGSTTVSTTLTGVVAGHDIRVFYCISANTLTVTGITVNGSAATLFPTATLATGVTFNCGGGYFPNSPSGTNTIVATGSASATQLTIYVEEWAGDATSGTLDGQNATFTADGTSGTSLPGGSITTANSNDTVEVWLQQAQGVGGTIPSGYTLSQNVSGFFVSAFKTGVTAGTYNPGFTSASGGNDNSIITAAFKASGGGGASTHNRTLTGVGQ